VSDLPDRFVCLLACPSVLFVSLPAPSFACRIEFVVVNPAFLFCSVRLPAYLLACLTGVCLSACVWSFVYFRLPAFATGCLILQPCHPTVRVCVSALPSECAQPVLAKPTVGFRRRLQHQEQRKEEEEEERGMKTVCRGKEIQLGMIMQTYHLPVRTRRGPLDLATTPRA